MSQPPRLPDPMTVSCLPTRAFVTALPALAVVSLGCSRTPPTPPPPAPPAVTVARPLRRTVTDYVYFTGRTEAVESAEIRARVPGFLKAMHFTVAQDVEAGEVLFTIETDVYEAQRDRAAAALASTEANLSRAQSDYDRVARAVETNAVSRQEVEKRKSERDMAKAAVLEAKANLQKAQLDLDYCTVTSPIPGQVSRNLVDVGNLVGSGENTLLATVAKMDPIDVYFEAGEDIVLKWLEVHNSNLEERRQDIPAFLGLSNDEDFPFEGSIDYIDNRVNEDTGTIVLRAAFSNAERKILPGMFAKIRVPARTIENAVIVEEKAIGTDLGGKYVLTVGDDNMVELKHVELGALENDERVILSGLGADELYITEGLMRARPGRPCTPQAADAKQASGTRDTAAEQG